MAAIGAAWKRRRRTDGRARPQYKQARTDRAREDADKARLARLRDERTLIDRAAAQSEIFGILTDFKHALAGLGW